MAQVHPAFGGKTGVSDPMSSPERADVVAALEIVRRTNLLGDFERCPGAHKLEPVRNHFHLAHQVRGILQGIDDQPEVFGVHAILIHSEQLTQARGNLASSLPEVSALAELDAKHPSWRLLVAKHRHASRVRSAARKGLKHAEENVTDRSLRISALVKITNDPAHR